jgi:hypothetical protein
VNDQHTETQATFVGCDELREWLKSQGFGVYTYSPSADNACNWYACRTTALDSRRCECNEKPVQIIVRPFVFCTPPHKIENVDVEVRGKTGDLWFQLMAYSLTPDELRARLPEIEARLIAAWNALI